MNAELLDALSRRIQKLEESLGAPLLERSTRHVKLTVVGRDFPAKMRRLIDEYGFVPVL
jgi:DNA-binding transcriptional LysR family regulator